MPRASYSDQCTNSPSQIQWFIKLLIGEILEVDNIVVNFNKYVKVKGYISLFGVHLKEMGQGLPLIYNNHYGRGLGRGKYHRNTVEYRGRHGSPQAKLDISCPLGMKCMFPVSMKYTLALNHD